MLIRFRVSNFRSLRDEQELSLVATSRDREDVVHHEETGLDLVRVVAIYGPNAAGKSNVLNALQFMQDAVRSSHRVWSPEGPVPREPFLLNARHQGEPSLLQIDFLLDDVRYQYGFRLDSKQIVEEWLHAFPTGRRQVWFHRDATLAEPFTFGKQMKGGNRTLAALTRHNSLFLSVAAENNHQALMPVYAWISGQITIHRPFDPYDIASVARRLKAVATDGSRLVEFMRLADLGIENLELHDEPVPALTLRLFELAGLDTFDFAQKRIEFLHRTTDGTIALPLASESRGTQAWLSIGIALLDTVAAGYVLCVDELDASLHPRLALEIIKIFQDPKRNPNGAQLIFNTHDATLLGNLLDEPPLHRDQIWFVEKDDEGATHLYPLTDFKPRKDENLERGYLQGRYGAIPFLAPQPAE